MLRIQKVSDTKVVGIAGAGRKCGCTHMAIVMAGRLHQLGYRVAILEENNLGTFENIAQEYNCRISGEDSFAYRGIDYYLYRRPRLLPAMMQKGYHFIIADHGDYGSCDRDFFSTNHPAIITCGSRPWEINELETVFSEVEDETVLAALHYCFPFTSHNKALQKTIITEMGNLRNIYFPPYTENPFTEFTFPDLDKILGRRNLQENTEESQDKKILIENKEPEGISGKYSVTQRRFLGKIPFLGMAGLKKELTEHTPLNEPDFPEVQPIINETIPNIPVEIIEPVLTEAVKDMEVRPEIETEDALSSSSSGFEKGDEDFIDGNPDETKREETIDVHVDTFKDIDTKIFNIEEKEPKTAPITAKDMVFSQGAEADSFQLFQLIKENQKNCLKTEFKKAVAEEAKENMLTLILHKQLQCAFGGILRTGANHTRETGKDGSPSIRIQNEHFQYEMREDLIKQVLEEDSVYLIFPEQDNFEEW